MLMPPTTTVTISRGTTTDAYGDPIDQLTPIYWDVPAIICYQAGTVKDPASGRPVQVSNYECVLPSQQDVKDQDVITDQQTQESYTVTEVRTLPSYGLPADKQVAMVRTDGA